jgi:hypothetical protein
MVLKMAITWSILKLEKCNGYQNLQKKNISNYVFFCIIFLSLERFLSYLQKRPFLLRPKVSLSVSPFCPMPYSIHFPLCIILKPDSGSAFNLNSLRFSEYVPHLSSDAAYHIFSCCWYPYQTLIHCLNST